MTDLDPRSFEVISRPLLWILKQCVPQVLEEFLFLFQSEKGGIARFPIDLNFFHWSTYSTRTNNEILDTNNDHTFSVPGSIKIERES